MNDVDRFAFFVGIDWGSEAHQVCVLNAQGEPLGQRQVSHTAAALEELFGWLEKLTEGVLAALAVGGNIAGARPDDFFSESETTGPFSRPLFSRGRQG